jgi:hypothetical protein
MSQKRKYSVLWDVLIIFMGLDIWLLYARTDLKQQVRSLQGVAIQKNGATSALAHAIRFTPAQEVADDPKPPLALVAVFTDYGCGHCAKAEIRHLNKWKKNFPGTLRVYYTGSSPKYLKNFGAKFSFKMIGSAKNLFPVSLPIGNPLVVLVDQNNDVQAIHTDNTSRPGSDQRRVAFYQRMQSLFTAIGRTP